MTAPRASLEARTALVTGASSGIGAAIARAFAGLGWSVAIGARRVERLEPVARDIESAGGKAFSERLDVADPASLDTFFDAAERALGPVDVLVCNAGLSIPALLEDARPEDLQAEVATNLVGPMLIARRAVRSLRARGAPGDLVFVSSENAVRPRSYQIGYTATKMGLEGVARVLAMELEGSGIRSTVVRPGPTRTGFGRDWPPDVIESVLESWKHWGLLRHFEWLTPEAVARAVVSAVTAAPGVNTPVVEIMPDGPGTGDAPRGS